MADIDQDPGARSYPIGRRTVLKGGAAAAALGATAGLGSVPAGAQASRKTMVFANGSAYDTMDPHFTFDVGRVAYRINLYDGLMRWLDNPPKLEPWLAESYQIGDGGKRYTFKLRRGVKFHDGTELTATDVVYSMERILALKKGAVGLYSDVIMPGSTKALDSHTVEFNLKEPSATFLATTHDIYVVNSALCKRNERGNDWGSGWLARNYAGSGSFMLERFDPARGFLARRNPNHFLPWPDPHLDRIEFRYVAEVNSRVLGMIRGDFQGTDPYLPQDQVVRLKAEPNVNVMEAESTRLFYAAIHNSRPPLNDVNLRKAISYCFDYDGFINNILSGTVVRNPGPIPNPMWGAPQGLQGYTYDIDKAKHHLSLVRGPMRELVVAGMIGYEQSMQAAALLQNGLSKAGIPSRLVNEPWPVVAAKGRDPEQMYDMLFLWRSTYFADPHNWAGYMYWSKMWRAGNYSFYKNDEVDRLVEAALRTPEQDKRRPLYEQLSRKLVDDAAGIFVYNTKWYGPFLKSVRGVRFCPIGDGQEMRWVGFA